MKPTSEALRIGQDIEFSCQDSVSLASAVITAEIRVPAARTHLLYPDC